MAVVFLPLRRNVEGRLSITPHMVRWLDPFKSTDREITAREITDRKITDREVLISKTGLSHG